MAAILPVALVPAEAVPVLTDDLASAPPTEPMPPATTVIWAGGALALMVGFGVATTTSGRDVGEGDAAVDPESSMDANDERTAGVADAAATAAAMTVLVAVLSGPLAVDAVRSRFAGALTKYARSAKQSATSTTAR